MTKSRVWISWQEYQFLMLLLTMTDTLYSARMQQEILPDLYAVFLATISALRAAREHGEAMRLELAICRTVFIQYNVSLRRQVFHQMCSYCLHSV